MKFKKNQIKKRENCKVSLSIFSLEELKSKFLRRYIGIKFYSCSNNSKALVDFGHHGFPVKRNINISIFVEFIAILPNVQLTPKEIIVHVIRLCNINARVFVLGKHGPDVFNGNTFEAGEDPHYAALIIYMPEEVGNVANYRGDTVPEVELGITVKAEQIKN